MANTIKLKRGLSSNVSSLTLQPGEVAIVLDLGTLKYGDEDGIVKDLIVTAANSATKANVATALENTILINGVDFNGSVDIEVPALIEAGDHIEIESDKVINVLDIGELTELGTTDKSNVVKAINEVVAANSLTGNNLIAIKTDLENKITQINKRIDQIDTGIVELSMNKLINDLLTIDETNGIGVGDASSPIQTIINDNTVKFYSGNREFLSIRENVNTKETQTFCDSLNAKSVVSGVHERKIFTINGERRTGFFYTDGGEN